MFCLHYHDYVDEYFTEILPGGGSLETPQASEHFTTDWGDSEPAAVRDDFRLDGKWKHQRICWDGPAREPH